MTQGFFFARSCLPFLTERYWGEARRFQLSDRPPVWWGLMADDFRPATQRLFSARKQSMKISKLT
jgi:hypothetical protein